MSTSDSVLIVEDEVDWRAIYERAAKRQGFTTVKTAGDLESAVILLDERKFAVAFVDIGLNIDDDRNVDGLRVMERIRALGDETSIIVVTGRSGADVVSITRDALKKYDAFDAVGKVPIEPADIQRLLVEALKAYKEKEAAGRPAVQIVLRGAQPPLEWDDHILRLLRISRGAEGLYGFLESLFARFLPVVARPDRSAVVVDSAIGVAHGVYWSRAAGQAVGVVFGQGLGVGTAVENHGMLLDANKVGQVLHSATAGEVKGFVYALPELDRHKFAVD